MTNKKASMKRLNYIYPLTEGVSLGYIVNQLQNTGLLSILYIPVSSCYRIWLNTSCGIIARVSSWDISNTARARTQNKQSGGAKTCILTIPVSILAVSNYD